MGIKCWSMIPFRHVFLAGVKPEKHSVKVPINSYCETQEVASLQAYAFPVVDGLIFAVPELITDAAKLLLGVSLVYNA